MRLAGPDRADFFRGVVTDGEDEIEAGRGGPGELLPALASETVGWQMSTLELRDGLRPNGSGRVAAGAVGSKVRTAFVVHDGLGHDGAGGISGA